MSSTEKKRATRHSFHEARVRRYGCTLSLEDYNECRRLFDADLSTINQRELRRLLMSCDCFACRNIWGSYCQKSL
jgi:hypothetical protein